MNKRLCIALFALLLVVPTMAQQAEEGKRDASFAPRKGQWEVSAHIGNSQMFNQDLSGYLLPTYYSNGNFWNPVGLPGGTTANQSGDPSIYLNLGSLENNSLVNLIGLQGKYFITDHVDINVMFNMNIQMTQSKDFIEGDNSVNYLPIQQSQYMEGRLTNIWSANVGSNYYFNTRNERISFYVGGTLGWQMGNIQTVLPYTGETVPNDIEDEDQAGDTDDGALNEDQAGVNMGDLINDPIEMYIPNSRAGQIMALKAAANFGVEFAVAKGLVVGFEVQPISYVGSMTRICPKAATTYVATHHHIGLLSAPRLRLGFRF